MTLSRQLIALISITFLLIFSGTFWISMNNTRSYLMLQLASQTQNASDSLGLSLAPHLQRKDIAAMDTMVNAVFDSGYYKSLKLTTMSGKTLIERESSIQIKNVPLWFINHLRLQTPAAESIITTGWKQAGRLTLTAHPGFAYKKLWDITTQTFEWSLLAFVISMISVLLILKTILRPLNAVEKQALAICNREFPVVDEIPRSRELKRVVTAMNRMSRKLQSSITLLTERAEKMRHQAYDDELTGLINRRGFNAILNNTVKDREKGGVGALALIRVADFEAYNHRYGHQAGDDLLVDITTRLIQLSKHFQDSTVSRVGGGEFAVLLPLADVKTATEFATGCSKSLEELNESIQADAIGYIGITTFENGDSLTDILAAADAAQVQAQHFGPNQFHIQHNRNEAPGNQAWKKLIEDALSQQHINFLSQAILDPRQQPIYREVLFRIRDNEGKDVSPGTFAAMAERLLLHRRVDQFVIESILHRLKQQPGIPLGINLSFRSIQDADFMQWLEKTLQAHPESTHALLFELTESGLLQAGDAAGSLIDLAHRHGVRIVMEHFGARLSSFQTLRKIKLDFIKLDGSYIHNMKSNSDNQFFLQTVTDIAHGLDIKVIAEQIETEDDFIAVKALGINAMQGYHFGEPEPL